MRVELPVVKPGLVIGLMNLETGMVEPNPAAPIYFNCTSRIDCCTTMNIPASEFDIDRIMEHGYELDQIIEDMSPIILNPNAAVGPRQKAYILKRKPFDKSCTFLEDDLCRIHQFKPFACRLYPFALDFIDDHHIRLVIHQDQLCHSIKAVPPEKANNRQLLEDMLSVIFSELHDRGIDL